MHFCSFQNMANKARMGWRGWGGEDGVARMGWRDQVGGWGRRRVDGVEDAESGQQEAGHGGVDVAR